MSTTRPWAILRLLLTTHLWLVPITWGAFVALDVVVTGAIALFGTVEASVWNQAGSLLRWLALAYGTLLTRTSLPSYVAQGRTRRESLLQLSAFLVIASAAFAALMTVGYPVEAAVYRAFGWPHAIGGDRLFTGADQPALIFASYWILFLLWTLAGALVAAGFYRGWGPATLLPGILLLLVSAFAVGFSGLPFVGAVFSGGDLSLPAAAGLSAGTFLSGVGLTWLVVRDMPIRTA